MKDTEQVKREIDILNLILTEQTCIVTYRISLFKDMTEFIPFKS